jgi:hypothetical protein
MLHDVHRLALRLIYEVHTRLKDITTRANHSYDEGATEESPCSGDHTYHAPFG